MLPTMFIWGLAPQQPAVISPNELNLLMQTLSDGRDAIARRQVQRTLIVDHFLDNERILVISNKDKEKECHAKL